MAHLSKCIDLCNSHCNQDTKLFNHHKYLPCATIYNLTTILIPTLPTLFSISIVL